MNEKRDSVFKERATNFTCFPDFCDIKIKSKNWQHNVASLYICIYFVV
jgi:hypothetical protein